MWYGWTEKANAILGYINNFQVTEYNSILLFDGQIPTWVLCQLSNTQLTKKLILRASASIDRLCLKDIMKEEQADLKVNLKMTGYKKDIEKILHWIHKWTCPN